MKIHPQKFRVAEGQRVKLDQWPTRIKPLCHSSAEGEARLARDVAALSAQQQLLYASDQHALLVIFQAMDAAGKDGVIRHVLSGINPQGCQVFSFKHPSLEELDHDFLWRSMRSLPERGRIGVFNRSYYEDVLIVRVHPEILQAQRLPDVPKHAKDIWRERFRSIRDFEQHLHANGTHVIKFFLHLSKEEQRQRFIARIDEAEKNWKFSQADIVERRFWDQYMHAYEEALTATSTEQSPWYVVPADDKQSARLIVARILLAHFKSLKLAYPKTTAARRKELLQIRAQLMQQD
jgi:PPK2 family polyphosphate:nucleotide phosphotransferase